MPDGYDWAGGREALLRHGPPDAPVVLIAPALFEEANRTRALTVATMRTLAAHGIASALPDLPGQGDSLWPTVDARLDAWQEAFAAAATQVAPVAVLAIRGGTLIAGGPRRFHVEPVDGAALVRDLLRARRAALMAVRAPVVTDDPATPGAPLMLAGNLLHRDLLTALMTATPVAAERTVVVAPAPASPHRVLPGSKPWRAAEPRGDAALATLLAQEVAAWLAA